MSNISTTNSVFIVNALHLAGLVLLYYDHAITFSCEVKHYWGMPITRGNLLFFLNRYLTVVTSVIFLSIRELVSTSSQCQLYNYVHELALVMAQVIVIAIMFLRTYALYNCSKLVLGVLLTAAGIAFAVMTWSFLGQHAHPVQGKASQVGCQIETSEETAQRIAIAWMAQLGLDILVFCLTFIRTFRAYSKQTCLNLPSILFRDGILYFAAMAIANSVNIIALWKFPGPLRASLTQFVSCVSVVLASRLCLNMHHIREEHEMTSVLPSIGFKLRDSMQAKSSCAFDSITDSLETNMDNQYHAADPHEGRGSNGAAGRTEHDWPAFEKWRRGNV
jgi:hypothetical protein